MKRKKTKKPHKIEPPATVVPSTGSIIDTASYEVVKLWNTDGAAPVSGNSYYIVLDKNTKKGQMVLFHPFSLTKFTMSYEAFRQSLVVNDWQPTPEKLAEVLEKKVKVELSLKHAVTNEVYALIKHYKES